MFRLLIGMKYLVWFDRVPDKEYGLFSIFGVDIKMLLYVEDARVGYTEGMIGVEWLK